MKKILFFSILLCSSLNASSQLEQTQQYAKKIKENLLPDSNNYISPRYNRELGEKRSNLFDDIFQLVTHKINGAFWNPTHFTTQLDQVLKNRQKEKFHGRFIQPLKVKSNDRIIVFGDLQGAYHSLIRDVEFLHSKGIIDTNFKLTNPDTYIVFTGNIVERSPYLLQTMSIILMLMHNNPDQVFYIKGKDEQHKGWHSELLGTEIAHYYGSSTSNVLTKVDQFFNTLPLAIACTVEKTKPMLLLTSNGLSSDIINIASTQKPILNVTDIKVICKGMSEDFIYARSSGLILSEPERGIPVWTLSSAPTPVYTKLFDFYYDALCIINIKDALNTSTITLLNRDTRTKNKISKDSAYCLVSNSEITKDKPACSTKEPIVVGCTLDLSKGASMQGKAIKQAFSFSINNQNMEGGIDGKPLRVVFLDDEYTPRKTLKNIETFEHDYKTNLVVAPFGSATLESYLDKVKENKVKVLFPFTGSSLFRDPSLTSLVNLRPSNKSEGKALMDYSLKTSPRIKYLIFYQNDSFGRGILEGAQEVFTKNKKNHTLHTVSYERNQVDFSNLLPEIKNFNPDVILFASTAVAATELIRQLGIDYFTTKKVLGISDLSENNFKEFMKSKGIQYSYMQLLPPANLLTNKLMQAYFNQIGKYNLPLDLYSLEGYLAGALLIDALKKVSGPITHDKVIKNLEAIDTKDITGFQLKFNPQTRELSDQLWLVTDAGTADEKTTKLTTLPLHPAQQQLSS
ncbi:MAG TPA: ABC transporter substrate-binding protein [Candidatus Babeliales bacterium]|nr:ABC transporter substrate-binding protein [Candidatus Babeliales bacterium]